MKVHISFWFVLMLVIGTVHSIKENADVASEEIGLEVRVMLIKTEYTVVSR
jgi:hypothetical protein